MKKIILVLLLGLPMMTVASNCEDISTNIAEKIKNNGVDASQFQLKLIPVDQADQQTEGKIVGSCDRGQQKIVYVRSNDISAETESNEQAPTIQEQNQKTQSDISLQQEEATPPATENQESTPIEPEN
ncbi:DUF1161 domain-containing protein [Gilliamella apicola]|uniref:DUF1161 domain-containing protein n=1 Tax=Gilliamella apicola TaxID=1196095 RepID=UPI000A04E6EF|nr:DUF1161 domain-containing protein [Gilliamella apicola]ORF45027.1 hypothetical protein B5800_09630 [Gilliamella apicola]ORF47519.1 hypothetical protein B5803_12090 [Gilliamella apicola]ORF49833.1 hypothetical protein B5799_02810 [Gilliamella apicola]ORF50685.1 hypothetical protein B5802_12535 [Gilliamella apicola]ORF51442.1 hypothetical protein B5798_13415 [Gilliamella apicola]